MKNSSSSSLFMRADRICAIVLLSATGALDWHCPAAVVLEPFVAASVQSAGACVLEEPREQIYVCGEHSSARP